MSNYGNENPYYGNNAGGGGGGFVQNGSPYGSQGSQGDKKNKGQATIRPVTVKQLLEAQSTESDFTIDGVDLSQIILVGSVRNKSASHTSVSYEIGDGTGYIDVRQWLDTADDDTGKMDEIEQDKYVAILGSMKKFGGKIHVSATSIRPITDHNEVYNHLLKALYVSLSLRNPGGGGVANVGAGAGAGVSSDYKAGAAGNGGGVDHSAWASLPPLQRKIMEVVSAETDEDGIHVSLVSRQVGNADGQQVMDAIEHLMENGHVFSTIDDLHIKAM